MASVCSPDVHHDVSSKQSSDDPSGSSLSVQTSVPSTPYPISRRLGSRPTTCIRFRCEGPRPPPETGVTFGGAAVGTTSVTTQDVSRFSCSPRSHSPRRRPCPWRRRPSPRCAWAATAVGSRPPPGAELWPPTADAGRQQGLDRRCPRRRIDLRCRDRRIHPPHRRHARGAGGAPRELCGFPRGANRCGDPISRSPSGRETWEMGEDRPRTVSGLQRA